MFKCISVYKIKPESIISLSEKYKDIIIAEDEKLAGNTYLFVPISLYNSDKKAIRHNLMGAFSSTIPTPITEDEVNRMLVNINVREEVLIGSTGVLEGFGSVPFYVFSIEGDTLEVIPVEMNLYKPIICKKDQFKVVHSEQKEYCYTAELAIDCDIIPLLNSPHAYILYKSKIIQIVSSIHKIIDQVNINLLNPSPLMAMAGASLGVKSVKDSLNIISTDKGASIRVCQDGSRVVKINKIIKTDPICEPLEPTKVINLFRYVVQSCAISEQEAYHFLNKKYFNNNRMLDINITANPLGGN